MCLASSRHCYFVSQRCKYDTCNCQNNEDCMCAALSSYAQACAAKGVMLWGWREHVCSECFPTGCSLGWRSRHRTLWAGGREP